MEIKLTTLSNSPVLQPVVNKPVQKLRLYAQLFSLAINIWIGIQFYYFVEYLASHAAGLAVARPSGIEAYLPIGALMALRSWFQTGQSDLLHPAGLVILIIILLTAFLFKKGFCSWVCPVGFISEMVGEVADKLWKRKLRPPKWLDYPLRSLKYIILGFFTWVVFVDMTQTDIFAFLNSDYNMVADIAMLRLFTDMTRLTLYVLIGLFVLSFFIRAFWCRYLCPYGALLGLIGLVSPTRIRRNQVGCSGCNSCSDVCPSLIKVAEVKEVVSDECIGCMACVDSCPVGNTLQLKLIPGNRKISSFKWAAILLVFFWGALLTARLWGPWDTSITEKQYIERIDDAMKGSLQHP